MGKNCGSTASMDPEWSPKLLSSFHTSSMNTSSMNTSFLRQKGFFTVPMRQKLISWTCIFLLLFMHLCKWNSLAGLENFFKINFLLLFFIWGDTRVMVKHVSWWHLRNGRFGGMHLGKLLGIVSRVSFIVSRVSCIVSRVSCIVSRVSCIVVNTCVSVAMPMKSIIRQKQEIQQKTIF